jgi:tetratricopeptide (TPR) repeat protein
MAKQRRSRPPVRRPTDNTPPVRLLAGVATILVATCIAYFPAIGGEFILDDHLNLTENPLIRAPDGPYKFWFTSEAIDYWPVFNTALWLEWRLWGPNPIGYHVVNLVLHILTTLLVWVVLARLTIPGAFLAAFLFAVHPVNVESVAWISQLKNLLALLFSLVSVLLYLDVERQPGRQPARSRPRLPVSYVGSLVTFTLAMLSKGSAAVLPLLLVGIIRWLRPLTKRDVARLAPFFAVCVVLVPVNVWFQARLETDLSAAGPIERLLAAGAIVWFYLAKALVPLDLAFIYPRWQVSAVHAAWWIPLLAAGAVTALLWRYRRRWGRPLLFAWGYFCVSLAPVMGFTRVGFMDHSLVADHYQHVALIGVMALVAAGLARWPHRGRGVAGWAANGIAAALVGTFAVLTWDQSGLYSDAKALFQDTLKKNPHSWMAHNNLGAALTDSGLHQEAIGHLEEALRLKPDYADAHNNLGNALLGAGHPEEAIAHFQKAVELKPAFPTVHYNLGTALAQLGKLPEAIEHYQKALHLRPGHPQTHINLGNALADAGQFPAAIELYEQALRLQPDFAAAHYNLGIVLTQAGRSQEAIAQYEQALRLEPDYARAHNDLGVALVNLGRVQEAIGHFQHALRLQPDLQDAQYNLEIARHMTPNTEKESDHRVPSAPLRQQKPGQNAGQWP